MASGPKVSVLLELVDRLTQPVNGARGSLTKFGNQVSSAFKAVGVAIAALGLGKFFKSAIEEAAAAQQSMSRFDVALRNIGLTYKQVAPEAEALFKHIQKTTRFADDDAREALARLVTLTGDYGKSVNLLGLAADVAAYKHISLEEAASLVGKAHEGNTRVLREFGITATSAADGIEQLRGKTQGFAQDDAKTFSGALEQIKNKWADILEAIGNAVVGNDEVGGAMGRVVGALTQLEGWITKNEAALTGFVNGAITLAEWLGKLAQMIGGYVVHRIEVMAENFWAVAYAVQSLPIVGRRALGGFLQTIGEFAGKASGFLKKFGIDIGSGIADDLATFGRTMRERAEEDARFLSYFREQQMASIKGTSRAATDAAAETATAAGTITRTFGGTVGEVTTRSRAAVLDLGAVFGQVVPEVISTVERELTPAVLTHIDAQESFRKKLGEIKQAFGEHQRAAEAATDEEQAERTKRFAGEMTGLMRGVLGAGQAMGIFSDATAAALQNAINLGESIGKIASGDVMGGITQGIGSLAGLLKGFLGESEAARKIRLALEGNTKKLEEHRRAIGDLVALQSTGGKLAGAQAALTRILPILNAFKDVGLAVGGKALSQALARAGYSASDLDAVAKDLGLTIRDSKGQLNARMLLQMLEALGEIEPTRFAETFAGQREKLRSETSLFDLTETQQAERLRALAGGSLGAGIIGQRLGGFDFGTASGRAGAIGAIQQLFADLPGLSAGDLGGLTGAQFLEVLQDLKDLLGADLPDGATTSGGTTGGDLFEPPTGDAPAPATSLADLLAVEMRSEAHLATIAGSFRAPPTTTTAPAGGGGVGVTVTMGDLIVYATPGTDGKQVGAEAAQAFDEELGRLLAQLRLTQGSADR